MPAFDPSRTFADNRIFSEAYGTLFLAGGYPLIMPPDSDQGKINRRGCFVFAVLIPLIVLLLVAISLGWVGQIDRGKITDLPVARGNNL